LLVLKALSSAVLKYQDGFTFLPSDPQIAAESGAMWNKNNAENDELCIDQYLLKGKNMPLVSVPT
jgi:hypothetical protein